MHKTIKTLRIIPKSVLLLTFVVLSSLALSGQETEYKGRPIITNYRYQDYGASGVNWWVTQDDRGFMYFANGSGILEYDGINWRVIEPPENTETRSMAKGADGTIYAGTNGDMGYLSPDEQGSMQFISLKHHLPEEYRIFEEVWQTSLFQDKIYFQTNHAFFVWDGSTMQVLPSVNRLHVVEIVNNNLYCRVWNEGLKIMKGDSLVMLPNGERFKDQRIYAILPYDEDHILIGSRNEGLFLYDGNNFSVFESEVNDFLKETGSLYTGLDLDNGNYILTTFSDGLVIIDHEGNLLQKIDKSVGLQDNSVTYPFLDRDGNLWLSLFNGIAKIELNSPFTYFDDKDGLPSKTVFPVVRHEGILYAGTQNGAYYLDQQSKTFKLVPGTNGQTSDLDLINGELIASSGSLGVIAINKDGYKPIRESVNYDYRTSFTQRSKKDPNLLWVILQDGLSVLRLEIIKSGKNRWVEESTVKGIYPTFGGFAEEPNGQLWITGDSPGTVKRLTPKLVDGKVDLPNSNVEIFDSTAKLPKEFIGIFPYDDIIYFGDGENTYLFDEEQQEFKQDTPLISDYIGNRPQDGSEAVKDSKGRMWASLGDGPTVQVTSSEGVPRVINKPFKSIKNDFPIWWFYPETDEEGNDVVWMSGPEGILRYTGDIETSNESSSPTYIRSVNIGTDSVAYGGSGDLPKNVSLSRKSNVINLEYGSPFFNNEESTQFQTYLEGFDDDWSSWSNKSSKEFINLPPGKYTFKVKSKNVFDVESTEASFDFSVQRPWYNTWWSWLLYIACLGGLIYFIVKYRTRHLKARSLVLERKVQERTKEVQQQADELSTVNQISRALATQLEMDDLLNLVGDQMQQLFKANIVYLALLDKETGVINFPYQYGDNMEPIKFGDGLTSKVIREKQPILINEDVKGTYSKMGIDLIGKQAASYLGVPIQVGNEVNGVLSVQSTEEENRFDNDDLHLLHTIASHVGIALYNAALYEEAKQAKAVAEEANEAKSAFLSTVSHELRTPLTSVLGFAKIIKKRLDERIFPLLDPQDKKLQRTARQVAENLEVVVSEGERLTTLVNDVLDLAKIEAGKVEWHMDSMNIQEALDRAIAATSSLFLQKQLELRQEFAPDLPEFTGDKDKLIQVVINLLSNAVKFTESGEVKCNAYQEGEKIVVSVTDTGIGIAPQDQDSVFEKFKQVGDTLTDKPKGTGLGLPICKEIVERHGGTMWVESKIGSGSTFFFSIPIDSADDEKFKALKFDDLVLQLKEQFQGVSKNGADRTILVVDDETPIRSLLRQELSEVGYQVIEAADGMEALDMVRAHKPDLIILDVMMPEMNGFDVAAVLKNDPKTMDIPIIILSIVQDKKRGFRIGVDRYLTKPIDTEKLFGEIGNLIGQGKSKKKVMIVDEDASTVNTLMEVLKEKGYHVVEANGPELIEKAITTKPDIIILNSLMEGQKEAVKSLRLEKGMENVLFLVYQ